MKVIDRLIQEALDSVMNYTNLEKIVQYREKSIPEQYWEIVDDMDGLTTDERIYDEYKYVVSKTLRGVDFPTFCVDPKWKPSSGYSDLYCLSKRILKNELALQMFMLEPQTQEQEQVKKSLLTWFKAAKANNCLNLVPYLAEIIRINRDYQTNKRAKADN